MALLIAKRPPNYGGMNTMNSAPGSKPTNLVQAIERATLILDTLSQKARGVSLKELSAEVALPKGTTHRLLASLAYFGYVRQDLGTRDYLLGFRLVELGNRLLNQLDLRTEAKPLLLELGRKVKETVHLVILDQNDVLYIDKVESDENPGGLRMASRIGSRTQAHSCAVGKVLLADLSEDQLDEYITQQGLPKLTERTLTDPAQLKEHLEVVRMQGYAVDDEENEQGIRCVAAPIRNESGKVIAATSISGPAIRITRERIRDTLQREIMETAASISSRLGFREEQPLG
jgi:IclR family KDG regulon transcriptional repressor